jgi:hypothetical protein
MDFNEARENAKGIPVHSKSWPNGIEDCIAIVQETAGCGVPGELEALCDL